MPPRMVRAGVEREEKPGVAQVFVKLRARGGIGKPLEETQRRFVHSVDDYPALIDTLRGRRATHPGLRIGVALHSLCAVAPDETRAALAGMEAIDAAARLHIHVSETTQEKASVRLFLMPFALRAMARTP